MNVVLDTNIFISGIFWSGISNKILESWKSGKFNLVVSIKTILEIVKVLGDFKIRLPEENIKEIADFLVKNSIVVEPTEKIDIIKEDPTDNIFIEAAIAGKADYIISQDKHLLKQISYKNIKIISPEEFDSIINS